MNKIISIAMSVALTAVIVFLPVKSHAQATQDQGGSTYSNPNSTTNGGNNSPGTTTDSTQTNDNGFNLWWLLPLIALPLLYLAFRQGNRDDETRTYDTRSSMAGVKGGSSRSNDDRDDEEAL